MGSINRRPRTNRQVVVETQTPISRGYAVFQELLRMVPPVEASTINPDEFPARKYVSWSVLNSHGSRSGGMPRWFNTYVMSLFARQAYLHPERQIQYIGELFGETTFAHWVNQTSGKVDIQIYSTPEVEIIAVPGTQAAGELISTSSLDLGLITGEPTNFLFYAPFIDYFARLYTLIKSNYDSKLSSRQKPFMICGHSRGGAIANWLAYRLNNDYADPASGIAPIAYAYTYGSAAGWCNTLSNANIFCQRHQHFLMIAPNDPVPGLVQCVILLGFSLAKALGTVKIPQHYVTYDTVIGQPSEARNQLQALAALLLAPKFAANVPSTDVMKDAHKVSNYCNLLMDQCMSRGDTPVGYWQAARRWHQSLDGTGVEEAELID